MQARDKIPAHSYVLFRKTPSNDLIRTVFEEIRFFPKEEPHLSEETMSILTRPIRRYLPGSKI